MCCIARSPARVKRVHRPHLRQMDYRSASCGRRMSSCRCPGPPRARHSPRRWPPWRPANRSSCLKRHQRRNGRRSIRRPGSRAASARIRRSWCRWTHETRNIRWSSQSVGCLRMRCCERDLPTLLTPGPQNTQRRRSHKGTKTAILHEDTKGPSVGRIAACLDPRAGYSKPPDVASTLAVPVRGSRQSRPVSQADQPTGLLLCAFVQGCFCALVANRLRVPCGYVFPSCIPARSSGVDLQRVRPPRSDTGSARHGR